MALAIVPDVSPQFNPQTSKTTFVLLDKRFSGMLLWHRLVMFERHLAIEAGDYDHGTGDDL